MVSISGWVSCKAISEVEVRVHYSYYGVLLGSTPEGKRGRKSIGIRRSQVVVQNQFG